jgi:hypothetical protein
MELNARLPIQPLSELSSTPAFLKMFEELGCRHLQLPPAQLGVEPLHVLQPVPQWVGSVSVL